MEEWTMEELEIDQGRWKRKKAEGNKEEEGKREMEEKGRKKGR